MIDLSELKKVYMGLTKTTIGVLDPQQSPTGRKPLTSIQSNTPGPITPEKPAGRIHSNQSFIRMAFGRRGSVSHSKPIPVALVQGNQNEPSQMQARMHGTASREMGKGFPAKRQGASAYKSIIGLETGETVADEVDKMAPILQMRKVIPNKGSGTEEGRPLRKAPPTRSGLETGKSIALRATRRLSIGTASKTREIWMPNPRSSCMLTPQSNGTGMETLKRRDILDRYFENSTLEGWNIEG